MGRRKVRPNAKLPRVNVDDLYKRIAELEAKVAARDETIKSVTNSVEEWRELYKQAKEREAKKNSAEAAGRLKEAFASFQYSVDDAAKGWRHFEQEISKGLFLGMDVKISDKMPEGLALLIDPRLQVHEAKKASIVPYEGHAELKSFNDPKKRDVNHRDFIIQNEKYNSKRRKVSW